MDGLINFTNKYHNTVYSDKKKPLKLFTFPVGARLDAAIRTKVDLLTQKKEVIFLTYPKRFTNK